VTVELLVEYKDWGVRFTFIEKRDAKIKGAGCGRNVFAY